MTSPIRFQFHLRTLLLLVTAVSVILSMTKWLHELGIAISLLSMGVVLLCVGVWSKRKICMIGGCALICGLVISAPWLLTAVCWVGHKKIPVTVRVKDRSGAPIPNATVRLTDKDLIGSSTDSTDVSGLAHVVGDFQTYGTDTLLSKTGSVEVLGERLSVRAGGFKDLDRELDEMVGNWDLYAPTPPEVLVQLEPDGQGRRTSDRKVRTPGVSCPSSRL